MLFKRIKRKSKGDSLRTSIHIRGSYYWKIPDGRKLNAIPEEFLQKFHHLRKNTKPGYQKSIMTETMNDTISSVIYPRTLISFYLRSLEGKMDRWGHHNKLLLYYHKKQSLTSSVIYYWTDVQQHGIYLLIR